MAALLPYKQLAACIGVLAGTLSTSGAEPIPGIRTQHVKK